MARGRAVSGRTASFSGNTVASETVARLGFLRLGPDGLDLVLGLGLELGLGAGLGVGLAVCLGLGLSRRRRHGLNDTIPVASAGCIGQFWASAFT